MPKNDFEDRFPVWGALFKSPSKFSRMDKSLYKYDVTN